MIPAASQVSSAEMVAHYEHLRGTVLDPLNRLATLPGLALFLRQGMTAWMRAWSNITKEPISGPDRAATQTHPPLPQNLQAQLAMILAGIILSQHREITL